MAPFEIAIAISGGIGFFLPHVSSAGADWPAKTIVGFSSRSAAADWPSTKLMDASWRSASMRKDSMGPYCPTSFIRSSGRHAGLSLRTKTERESGSTPPTRPTPPI